MKTSEFACLFEKLGYNLIKTNNVYWLISPDGITYSFPTLDDVYPSKNEVNYLQKLGKKVVIFKTNYVIKNSFEYVYCGKNYSMELFDSKIRNQIKKGLKSCSIVDANINDLINYGYYINKFVLEKQSRSTFFMKNKDIWKNYITTLYEHPEVSIKGAYINDELIAYSIFFKVNEKYYIYHPYMNYNYSSSNPMNAILYSFINDVILKEGEINISYGLASFSEKKGLDKFKKGMLFEELPTTRIVCLSNFYNLIFSNFFKPIIFCLFKFKLVNENSFNAFVYMEKSKKLSDSYFKNFK